MGNAYIVENSFTGPDGTAYSPGDTLDDALVSITALRAAGGQLTPTNTALAERAAFAVQARTDATARGGKSVEPAIPLQNVKGGYRRSGQAVISAAATTAAVVLTPAEPDTNYRLHYSIVALSDATPAAGSTNVFVPDKAVGGFTLTLDAAPGGSDTVTIDWSIERD